jgi:hypothetical protein
MSWMNSDGLYVKFGLEEGKSAVGGEYSKDGAIHEYEVTIDYTEVLSATYAIVDGGAAPGPLGVVIPEGLRVTEVEVFTATAFTSSGTIGSAVLSVGLKKKSDRSTELDHDGFLTASFVGGVFDAANETTVVRTGTTGVGALITGGSVISEDGVIVAANTAHASHPFTAGKAIVKIRGYYP